jgi:hypothetical protein
MKRTMRLTTAAVAGLLSIIGIIGSIGPAHVAAGGWAITSLDPFEQPVAGQPITIGFTILQHGVTPVEVEGAGIRVFQQGTTGEFFPAIHDGDSRIGHYTARVVFPKEGTFTWLVEQGFFEAQALGQITITSSAADTASRWPTPLRYGLPLVAVLCVGVIVGGSARGRRHLAVR